MGHGIRKRYHVQRGHKISRNTNNNINKKKQDEKKNDVFEFGQIGDAWYFVSLLLLRNRLPPQYSVMLEPGV